MAARHSEKIEMQQEEDVIYENVGIKIATREEEPQKTLQPGVPPDIRLYKLVGAGVGLLCVAQALLNIGLRLSLYQSYMVEGDQLVTSYNLLKTRYNNLTEEKLLLQIRLINLTHQKELLETSFKQLEIKCNNLTEDALNKTSCESDGFTFGGGLCYYISTESKTWEESRQYCIDKQSDLIIIKSKEKQDFVGSLNQRVWLGLTDRDEEGIWKWVDATTLTTPTYWNNSEPNNLGGEDCAELYGGGWNDAPCGGHNRWICERVI